MENGNGSNGGKAGRKAHYCVLYTQALKQWGVSEIIQRVLPEGAGEVFYPCRELWWHGRGETVFRPLFPGYVFIRTEMDGAELHGLVLRARREILSFVRELGAGARRAAGEENPHGGSGILDLTDEEAEFFDFLLGFRFDAELDRRREEAAVEGKLYKPALDCGLAGGKEAAVAELRRRKKRVPPRGVVQMSFGYTEGGRYVVMDGPLKGREGHIRDYVAKDRKAHLDIGVGGKPAKVGLTLLGKKVWFPKDKGSPDILEDGTAFDARELARIMMGGK